MNHLTKGTVIGSKYLIEDVLQTGGMSSGSYKVYDQDSGEHLFAKAIFSNTLPDDVSYEIYLQNLDSSCLEEKQNIALARVLQSILKIVLHCRKN